MSDWLQYTPHDNCLEIMRLGDLDIKFLPCDDESTVDLPLHVYDSKNVCHDLKPGQWVRKNEDGTLDVKDEKPND
jgi:hypothetical protein